ncbi:MAG: hypothetical protein SFV54_04105 [Bryobacteraceae bacterium]|nr:hypothetical protein [Bryobacteraceae bacterium]
MQEYSPGTVNAADNFDVRASFITIRDATRLHLGLIAFTVALSLGLITLYIVLFPPVFKASAIVMAEKEIDSARDAFYTDWSIFRKDDSQTEVELMRVGPVLEEVVKREKLTYDDVYHPFFSHLSYLWRKTPVAKAYQRFKSNLFRDPDNANFGPTEETAVLGDTLADMAAGITIEPVGETTVGRLTLRGPSRRIAQITNTLLEVYQEKRIQRHSDEAGSSARILTQQAEVAAKELREVGGKRLAFAQANGVTFDFQKETVEVGKLAELDSEIATARSRVATLDATVAELDRQIAAEPETKRTLTVFDLNAVREASKRKKLDLETTLLHDQARFRDDSPEIRDLRADIERLTALIERTAETVESSRTESLNNVRQEMLSKRKGLKAELEGARAGMRVMEANAEKLRERLGRLTALQTEMRTLDRDYALAQEKYNLLMVKRNQAVLSESTTKRLMPSLRVIERAVPPSDKSWPSLKILYPSALLVGLLLGVAAAVLRYYTSGQVRKDELEKRAGLEPVYGHIRVAAAAVPLPVALVRRGAAESNGGSLRQDAS